MKPQDRFRIGSTTKTYVATMILQLVGEQRLRLDDPVGRWLPGVLPPGKRAVTIRELLTHSSGLFDSMNDAVNAMWNDPQTFLATIADPSLRRRFAAFWQRFSRDPAMRVPPRIWVELAAAEPLYFAPGTAAHYSNTDFILLGEIVEHVTGRPLGVELRDRIVRPLRLHDTFLVTGPTPPAPAARLYTLPGGANSIYYRQSRPVDTTVVAMGAVGAGNIVASAEDVARFYAALLGGRLLPPALLQVMLDEGMGIGSLETRCGTAFEHNGGGFGYVSAPRATSDGSRVTVLLVNGRGRHETLGNRAADDLFCATP